MKTEVLQVTGMTCGGCATKITRALKAIGGVDDVTVSLASGNATVKFDEHQTSVERLNFALKDAGYNKEATQAAQGQRVKGGCCG